MSNEEIFKKAVEKAAKNGCPRPDDAPLSSWKHAINSGQAYRIIFSHDFAKAFWGEEEIDDDFADSEGCSDTYNKGAGFSVPYIHYEK